MDFNVFLCISMKAMIYNEIHQFERKRLAKTKKTKRSQCWLSFKNKENTKEKMKSTMAKAWFQWISIFSVHFNEFQSFLVDFNGIHWISIDFNEFRWISMFFYAFQ